MTRAFVLPLTLCFVAACQSPPVSIKWETYDVECDEPGPAEVTTVEDPNDIFAASIRAPSPEGNLFIAAVAVEVDPDSGAVSVGCNPERTYQLMLGLRAEEGPQ